MTIRLRQFASNLADTFWLLPAAIVAAGVLLAMGLVEVDRDGRVSQALLHSRWLYNGGSTGARTLLGAVASSTIGVAGTVFSITIASLSLAAGQMGPRLLRNFVRDRGNQATLGVFLGTFCYALTVLRTIRTNGEGEFIPHLSMSVGLALAFVCVGTLVYFVGHTASRINVDTVIHLVSIELTRAIARLTTATPPAAIVATVPSSASANALVADRRRGYLQHFDAAALADWAVECGTTVRLLVRPGDYVFPGATIACVAPAVPGAAAAISAATALGSHRVGEQDLEFAVRQLVEVAVRALSPGINDPHTAMSVLDRLAAALCELAGRNLPDGRTVRGGTVVVVVPTVDYDGLADAMFHLIRQNARGSAAVLIRVVEVLTAVAGCDRDPARLATLRRHGDLVMGDGARDIATPADLDDLHQRHSCLTTTIASGTAARAPE